MATFWLDEDWDNDHSGTGSLHDVSSWGSEEPLKISSRPIGFGADIDQKVRYSVRAPSRRISMNEAANLARRTGK